MYRDSNKLTILFVGELRTQLETIETIELGRMQIIATVE